MAGLGRSYKISICCKCEGLRSSGDQFGLVVDIRRRMEERPVSVVRDDVLKWLSWARQRSVNLRAARILRGPFSSVDFVGIRVKPRREEWSFTLAAHRDIDIVIILIIEQYFPEGNVLLFVSIGIG